MQSFTIYDGTSKKARARFKYYKDLHDIQFHVHYNKVVFFDIFIYYQSEKNLQFIK
jgi:hypothetical protein